MIRDDDHTPLEVVKVGIEIKNPIGFNVKVHKYDWREIWTHNILKFFGIKSTIINEELHAKSKDL